MHAADTKFWSGSASLAFVLLLSASFLPVVSAAVEKTDGAIEEIIDTATYRETNLMNTPQAISCTTDCEE